MGKHKHPRVGKKSEVEKPKVKKPKVKKHSQGRKAVRVTKPPRPLDDQERRVKNLATIFAAIAISPTLTDTPHKSPAQVDKHARYRITTDAVKLAKESVSKAMQSGESQPVDAQELERVVRYVLESFQKMGAPSVEGAAKKVLPDLVKLDIAGTLTERSAELTEVADPVIRKFTPPNGAAQPALGLLVLAGALLLGVGALIPLLVPAMEGVLINEVAIATLVVNAAALIEQHQ